MLSRSCPLAAGEALQRNRKEMVTVDWTELCSQEQREQLQQIARSTTAGIWRIKRAKIILGTLEGKSVDRLVLDVRVPPRSIIKCRERFAEQGMGYFAAPVRAPTPREANVERILAFLQHPPQPSSPDWDTLTHRYIGIYFSARQIQAIRDIIASNPRYTRGKLARELCTRFELYQPNGDTRAAIVAGILKRMDMDNMITLPKTPPRHCASTPSYRCIENPLAATLETMNLGPRDMEELWFVLVRTPKDAGLWNEMIRRHHYIKSFKLFGPRLRYLVYGKERTAPCRRRVTADAAGETGVHSLQDQHEWDLNQPRSEPLLAVLGFAASAWRLSSRDEFIGWTDEQRTANLRYVVSNARFLILPWIKSHNLASRILSGVVRQLPRDWEDRYHYRPVLLETFVELDRFTGTCYRAANWIRLGTTSGYSLYGMEQKKQVPNKAVFVYPLTKKFRATLCGAIA